jgi:hypothetical protein
MLIAACIYLFIGLVVMSATQVSWGPVEYLLGIILWPITILFFIWTKSGERRAERRTLEAIRELTELIRIENEKSSVKPGGWTPDRN